ncbi:MAG: ATP-binding cassette domain-containing protein [Roseobacter sp.]
MVASLVVENLTVGAPRSAPLLTGVCFNIQQGERVGLVGASGCGKSLTAATLCGLLRAPLDIRAGALEIDGKAYQGANDRAWRHVRGRVIFQIFQSPGTALTPVRRIGIQLNEAAKVVGQNVKTSVPRALDAVSLPQEVTRFFPYQLSGGMKQRVLIAMALILRPRILIADEPTTGLDVLTEQEILQTLNIAADETGASLLFISHDLRAVGAIANRTLVMDQGHIVEDADIANLETSKVPAARRLAEAAKALQASC